MAEIDRAKLIENFNQTQCRYAELMANPNKHKVSYNIDGQKVDWNQYARSLLQNMKDLKELIDSTAAPFEIDQQIIT